MTNEEVINVLNIIYENPTASEQIKEACIVAMEAVSIKNSLERMTTGLEISSEETCENELKEYDSLFRCSACGNQIDDTTDLGYSHGFNYCPNCGRKIARENEALATEG